MKYTCRSGADVICLDRDRVEVTKARALLWRDMSVGFLHLATGLYGERRTNTNRIICENHIHALWHGVPADYEVYSFDRKPIAVLARRTDPRR